MLKQRNQRIYKSCCSGRHWSWQ